jgi:hypothetical protein
MKLNKKIIFIIAAISSTYSFAGNNWYIHINNQTNNSVPVTISPDYGCFYTNDFVSKTILPNSIDYVYLEENNDIFSSCSIHPANKFATLLLNKDINQSIELNSYYKDEESYRKVGFQGNWEQIAGVQIVDGAQTINVYIDYRNDGTIKLTGYCSTDGPCTE